MKITLKDGSSKEYAQPMSVYDIAADISEGLARAACAGEIDGKVEDLRTVIDRDCSLNILTANDEAGLRVIRHTASHVMAEAVKRLFPNAKVTIGPAIDEGFYYDFDAEPFSREDLDKLEAEMKKIIKEGHKIERFTMPREEAIHYMEEKGEPYKAELIRDLPEDAEISFYDQGGFVDLCAGPHLMWHIGEGIPVRRSYSVFTEPLSRKKRSLRRIWNIWRTLRNATIINSDARWSCLRRWTLSDRDFRCCFRKEPKWS